MVPSLRSFRLRVSPAGTVMSLRTMSEQEVLLSEAVAASVKVQVDRLLKSVAREGAGAARAAPARVARQNKGLAEGMVASWIVI